jgi:hypothetical protein
VADSPVIWRELWTTVGALAARTERIRLGSAVTTALTRHAAVTASAALLAISFIRTKTSSILCRVFGVRATRRTPNT